MEKMKLYNKNEEIKKSLSRSQSVSYDELLSVKGVPRVIIAAVAV